MSLGVLLFVSINFLVYQGRVFIKPGHDTYIFCYIAAIHVFLPAILLLQDRIQFFLLICQTICIFRKMNNISTMFSLNLYFTGPSGYTFQVLVRWSSSTPITITFVSLLITVAKGSSSIILWPFWLFFHILWEDLAIPVRLLRFMVIHQMVTFLLGLDSNFSICNLYLDTITCFPSIPYSYIWATVLSTRTTVLFTWLLIITMLYQFICLESVVVVDCCCWCFF